MSVVHTSAGRDVPVEPFAPAAVAARLVAARRAGRALDGYPGGAIPADLAQAYHVQDEALRLWPDAVAGWKLGKIAPELVDRLGAGRVAGPIFGRQVWSARPGEPTAVPVFVGGFAAVEAEYVLRIARDADPAQREWTRDAALEMVDAMFIGVEMAGSPLATINALGPTVVASDFGNNAGLILGPEIAGWRGRALETLTCEVAIDGVTVGRGDASDIPDGPIDSVRFLLELQAARGRPLKRGDLISTGAATGVHDIAAGQSAWVDFGGDGAIALITRPAREAQTP